jgi:putative membrane protein
LVNLLVGLNAFRIMLFRRRIPVPEQCIGFGVAAPGARRATGSLCTRLRQKMIFSRFSAEPADANRRAVLIGALAVPATGLLAFTAHGAGPVSWHMAAHIAGMNVAAPLAAVAISHRKMGRLRPWFAPPVLWSVTLAQLAVLWAWHSPALHHSLSSAPAMVAALHLLLFAVALVFWMSIVAAYEHRWQAILTLLVSGKLSCLLGVLLTFAPRPLFAAGAHAAHTGQEMLLSDQRLAGLLMIAACPLSYVLTAVVLAAQAVNSLDQTRGHPAPSPSFGR